MKISKILAGVSAMALTAAMAISASAATTITISNPVTEDWKNPFPQFDPGDGKMTDDCIDAKSFTKDTALEVTINYEWAEKGTEQGYVLVKPASQAESWESLYKLGYLEDTFAKEADTAGDIGYKTSDGQTVGFAIKDDGFFVSNDPACNQVKFTITADGVNKMIAAATASDTAYEGIIFQHTGMKVNSIELSQDGVKLASEMKGVQTDNNNTNTDSKAPANNNTDSKSTNTNTDSKASTNKGTTTTNNGSTTANKTDSTANTGATAGLALAGIALAGAAFVVSKKK